MANKKNRKKSRYLVGYTSDRSGVWSSGYNGYIDTMTFKQAEKHLQWLAGVELDRSIFEIVPAKTVKGKK